MKDKPETTLYTTPTGGAIIAHRHGDGTVTTTWVNRERGCAVADLLLYRHDMTEARPEDGDTYRWPGRNRPTILIMRTEAAWNSETKNGLAQAALTDGATLEVQTPDEMTENHRIYIGLEPRRSPRIGETEPATILAFNEGDIALVKRLGDEYHVADPLQERRTGLADAVRYQREHGHASAHATHFRWDASQWSPIRRMTPADFRRWSASARTIGRVTRHEITMKLDEFWPMDRLYFGLIHPCPQ